MKDRGSEVLVPKGMVAVHWAALFLVAASIALLGFIGGVMYVVEDAYTTARKDLVKEFHDELRTAIVEGRSFYVQGSPIRLIPRLDGHMNVAIAGAEATVPARSKR